MIIPPNNKWELVDCNLCRSKDYNAVCSYGEIKIVRCNDCGLIYRNPRLKEGMNREFYSFDYYGEYEGIEERISNARLELFKNILSRLHKKIKSDPRWILDIGCGQGHFLKLAKDLSWEVSGVELAKSACDYAKREFDIDIVNAGIEEARFDDNSFDVVTMWNVLDHLCNPLDTLKEIRRILKPNGILIIRVLNVNFHIFMHKIFLLNPNIKEKSDPSVIQNFGFGSKTIIIMLKEVGFRYIMVYNSPLSSGDPYDSFKRFGYSVVTFIKVSYYIFSFIIYYLSFKKLLIGSSLLVYAKKQ